MTTTEHEPIWSDCAFYSYEYPSAILYSSASCRISAKIKVLVVKTLVVQMAAVVMVVILESVVIVVAMMDAVVNQ